LAETAVVEIDLAASDGAPLLPDDAAGVAPPLDGADRARISAALSDGSSLRWLRDPAPLRSDRIEWLRFAAAGPLELYMGMLGHAAVLRDDARTFAHLHPSGSVPMAALAAAGGDPHAGMMHGVAQL